MTRRSSAAGGRRFARRRAPVSRGCAGPAPAAVSRRAASPAREPRAGFTELLGIGDNEAFDLGGLVGAVIGVMLLLGVGRALQREKPDRRTERRRRKAGS